jgi:hypothetical protein
MLAEIMANHFIKFRKQAAAEFERGSVKQHEYGLGHITYT